MQTGVEENEVRERRRKSYFFPLFSRVERHGKFRHVQRLVMDSFAQSHLTDNKYFSRSSLVQRVCAEAVLGFKPFLLTGEFADFPGVNTPTCSVLATNNSMTSS